MKQKPKWRLLGILVVYDGEDVNYADGLAMGDEARERSVAAARAEIQSAIATW